jgi:hypothetical protein
LNFREQNIRAQDIRAKNNRKLLKLKHKDPEFAQYYADIQRWLPDVKWNEAPELAVLWQVLSDELKNALQHQNIMTDLTQFVKICSIPNLQIHTCAPEWKSRRWMAGPKKSETLINSISALQTAPAETVLEYKYPASMDLSAVNGK